MLTYTFEQNIAFIITGTLIIILNSLEAYFILKKRQKIKPYEHLLLNLALADFLVGGVRCGISIYEIYHSWWEQEKIAFWLIPGLLMFAILSSGMNILVISIDRLMAIKFPLKHRVWMSERNTRIVKVLAWIITVTCTGIFASLVHVYGYKFLRHHIETITILSFGTVMIIVHVVLIKHTLNKPDTKLSDEATKVLRERSWEKKVILTCSLFVANYIICTWPACIEQLSTNDFTVSFVTFVLFLMNSLIDPCLYFFKDYLRRNHWKAFRSKRQSSTDQESRREQALLEENI